MKKKNFEVWLEKVDTNLVKRCGLGRDGLPDIDYWNYFVSGMSPSECAKQTLREVKDYF